VRSRFAALFSPGLPLYGMNQTNLFANSFNPGATGFNSAMAEK
jgi:hypothetical protein